MIKKIDHNNMGCSRLGWLSSIFHFSFAQYYNKDNINFGALRVVNDDIIMPNAGFETHPHRDMEIVTYVIDGKLTHGDSMNNRNTLSRGDVQYMSAGTGILHSEMNEADEKLRLLQIWIIPDKKGYSPQYGDKKLPWQARCNQWLHIVSDENGNASIKIHQDMNIFVAAMSEGNCLDFEVKNGRQAYFINIEGRASINGLHFDQCDAAEIISENINIEAKNDAHVMILEMKENSEKL